MTYDHIDDPVEDELVDEEPETAEEPTETADVEDHAVAEPDVDLGVAVPHPLPAGVEIR